MIGTGDVKTAIESFVHQWVPGVSGDKRVLLALHGTGGNEFDLIPLAQTLAPGSAILSPRGRVDEQGSNRFFRRLSEGVFDYENMAQETLALAEFLRAAADTYKFDLKELVAVGFSNGANIAASLMLTDPSVLAGGVLIRAMVPFVPVQMPDLSGKRVFISSGRFDPIVPLDNVQNLAEMFRSGGAEVEHLVLDGGHNLTREDINAAQRWLAGSSE